MNPTQTPPPAPDLPGWTHLTTGKVRDLYVPSASATSPAGAGDLVLVVASDRISAYDWGLTPGITDKGKILTALTVWWFNQLADQVTGHLVADADLPAGIEVPASVAGRAVICRRLEMFPIECVARGFLTGSGLKDYRATGAVGGNQLPPGLTDGSRLAPAIYTPATKADLGEHDENIDYARTVELLGAADAEELRQLTLELYTRAEEIAREGDILLADTKFEFGRDPRTGQIVLGDEVLTPDSSRFWDAAAYRVGPKQPSFDKQFVRDWLTSPASGWDADSGEAPPALPAEIVEKTRARYLEAYERLTGEQLAL